MVFVTIIVVVAIGLGVALAVLPDTAPDCTDYLAQVATVRHIDYANATYVFYHDAAFNPVIADMVVESVALVAQGYSYEVDKCYTPTSGGIVFGMSFHANGQRNQLSQSVPSQLGVGSTGERHYCGGMAQNSDSTWSGWIVRHVDDRRSITDYTLGPTPASQACTQVVSQQQSGIVAMATVLIVIAAVACIAVFRFM